MTTRNERTLAVAILTQDTSPIDLDIHQALRRISETPDNELEPDYRKPFHPHAFTDHPANEPETDDTTHNGDNEGLDDCTTPTLGPGYFAAASGGVVGQVRGVAEQSVSAGEAAVVETDRHGFFAGVAVHDAGIGEVLTVAGARASNPFGRVRGLVAYDVADRTTRMVGDRADDKPEPVSTVQDDLEATKDWAAAPGFTSHPPGVHERGSLVDDLAVRFPSARITLSDNQSNFSAPHEGVDLSTDDAPVGEVGDFPSPSDHWLARLSRVAAANPDTDLKLTWSYAPGAAPGEPVVTVVPVKPPTLAGYMVLRKWANGWDLDDPDAAMYDPDEEGRRQAVAAAESESGVHSRTFGVASVVVVSAHDGFTGCRAGRDGDCTHNDCPQLADGEPKASGRHCPRDTRADDDL